MQKAKCFWLNKSLDSSYDKSVCKLCKQAVSCAQLLKVAGEGGGGTLQVPGSAKAAGARVDVRGSTPWPKRVESRDGPNSFPRVPT